MHDIDTALRNMLSRARIMAVNDSGGQQMVNIAGLPGVRPENIYRFQPHGFTSSPPQGAEGVLMALGGHLDRALFLGGEVPAMRPAMAPAGGAIMYDAAGNQLRMGKDNGQQQFSPGDMVIYRKIGKKIYLGGDPAQGGTFSPVMTAGGPSEVVMALVSDRDYRPPQG